MAGKIWKYDCYDIRKFKPKNIEAKERKKFATKVFEITKRLDLENFSGLFFSLQSGKTESIKSFLSEYDDKKLYYML